MKKEASLAVREGFEQIIKGYIEHFKDRLSPEDIQHALSLLQEITKEILLPSTIFTTPELSGLEAISVFLREEKRFSFTEMGKLLGRSPVTLSTTYRIAKQKRKAAIPVKETSYFIPASIFKDRKISVLENIVAYLHEQKQLRFVEIAKLLRRDQRTVWTAYSRAQKKRMVTRK